MLRLYMSFSMLGELYLSRIDTLSIHPLRRVVESAAPARGGKVPMSIGEES
jgi:hypothetical protein